ncbi:MAG TPA: glycoside hydrolase family 16 protein [Pyrinomonadaceae bacterium]|nr:glycoside hydrolase family 16 protein [Pyrinomonadaceae bacterium]
MNSFLKLSAVAVYTVVLFSTERLTPAPSPQTAMDSALPRTPAESSTTVPHAQILFDDFSYPEKKELTKNGWIIRTVEGWPGIPGATWSAAGVSILKDPNQPGNWILRMTSGTDGTAENTTQTQICHHRKYLEGTYAARVRFTDSPVSGPGGDQLVQSFYTISPLKAPMDLDYSELDFEYLPNGGWGIDGPTLYATTWETFSPEPNWKKDNVFETIRVSQAGWHTLVMQVVNQKVRYFVDGKLFIEHGGEYYPEDTMSINFNLWFIRDGMVKAKEPRQYQEDIDWVFFQAYTGLTPEKVEAAVANMRRHSVKFRDTVPPKVPALTSPCNF